MATRQELLNNHNNDYGFDVQDILFKPIGAEKLPLVSIVIPYYETGEIFNRCLYFLTQAISRYPGDNEIIVIDDGSVQKTALSYTGDFKNIKTIVFKNNRGRTEARNAGLLAAKGKVIFFLDSDILVDEDLVINHIKLHLESLRRNLKAICVGFFEFTDTKSKKIVKTRLAKQDIDINDFRIDCMYGATWIGCENDKQYIGQHLQLVNETQNFRSWKGQYKAWVLPNMVLGGVFSVIKEEIYAVGAFDFRFKGYGFTETSAVTGMIAERGNVVVPCLVGGAIHVEDDSVNLSQTAKDEIFKKKHNFYFNTFLKEEVS